MYNYDGKIENLGNGFKKSKDVGKILKMKIAEKQKKKIGKMAESHLKKI